MLSVFVKYAMARTVSAIVNFTGHKTFSFRSRGQVLRKSGKHVLAVIHALLLASVLLHISESGIWLPSGLARFTFSFFNIFNGLK